MGCLNSKANITVADPIPVNKVRDSKADQESVPINIIKLAADTRQPEPAPAQAVEVVKEAGPGEPEPPKYVKFEFTEFDFESE